LHLSLARKKQAKWENNNLLVNARGQVTYVLKENNKKASS
jgi:hypothetical protein